MNTCCALRLAAFIAFGGAASAASPQDVPPIAHRPNSFPEAIDNPDSIQKSMSSDVLVNRFDCPIGTQLVYWHHGERADSSSPWVSIQQEFSTSYWITDTASRDGGSELFIAGIDALGSAVIERWTFPKRRGGFYSSYGSAAPIIGTPQPEYTPGVELLSTPFDPDIKGSLSLTPTRTLISRSQGGVWSGISVDPEGRILMAYDFSSKELVKFDLTGGLPLIKTVILPGGGTSGLPQVGRMEIRDFKGTRALLINSVLPGENMSGATWTIILDLANDGEWDMSTLESMNNSSFKESIYSQWNDWKEFWRVPTH